MIKGPSSAASATAAKRIIFNAKFIIFNYSTVLLTTSRRRAVHRRPLLVAHVAVHHPPYAQFIIFNAQFISCNAQSVIFNAQSVICNAQFIITNTEFIILPRAAPILNT